MLAKSHVSEACECENPAMLRLRQEMLRRARIALREAQVLSALLDHVRNQPVCTTTSDRPIRAVFGFHLLAAPNQALSTESQKALGPGE